MKSTTRGGYVEEGDIAMDLVRATSPSLGLMSNMVVISWEDKSPSLFTVCALAFPDSVASISPLTCCYLTHCPATETVVQGIGPVSHTQVLHLHRYQQ